MDNLKEAMNFMAMVKNKPATTLKDITNLGYVNNCEKIDNAWRERLKEFWWATNYEKEIRMTPVREKMIELRNRLIDVAGEEMCMTYDEEDINEILEYGQFWIGGKKKTIMKKGEPSQCHRNSCNLYDANKNNSSLNGILAIATGYALSKDGMWRQHSWLVLKKARSYKIIETTQERELYFGFVMDEEMCEKFCYENY